MSILHDDPIFKAWEIVVPPNLIITRPPSYNQSDVKKGKNTRNARKRNVVVCSLHVDPEDILWYSMLVLACQGRKSTLFSLAFLFIKQVQWLRFYSFWRACALASRLAPCLFSFSHTLYRNECTKIDQWVFVQWWPVVPYHKPFWFDLVQSEP